MKIRKVFSAFIAAIMCLLNVNLFDFSSYAGDSEVTEIYLTANVNGQSQKLSALQNKDGNLFLSSSVLSDITVYKYIAGSSKFIHDNSDETSKYREIWIIGDKPQVQIVSYQQNFPIIRKTINLPDVLDYNGEKYFPLAELLPTLNSNATIIDDCLYIENVPYSMTNIMSEFNISEYMFNMYDDNDFLGLSDAKILAGYSYLFNGLVNFDLKRFVPIVGTRMTKIESYEEIFTSYLAEDETYFEAIGDEEHYELPMIKYLLDDDSERIDTIIEAMEPAKNIMESYPEIEISTDDLKLIQSSAWISEQLDYAIKLYSFAAVYTDHVTDHYEMLDSIYGLDYNDINNIKAGWTEESCTATKKTYEMYSPDQKQAISNYIGKQIEEKMKDMIGEAIEDGIADKLTLGNAFAWSKIAASVMKAYFIATDFPVYNVAQKSDNLGYYNKLMECGVSKFWIYNNAKNNLSHEAIEDARLSAIFTLLSSRSMYQAFLDSEKAYGNSGGVYQRKIDSINEMLKKLYLAKNCCLTDSEEYIDERIELLNSSMSSISVTNTNDEALYFEFDKAIFGAMTKAINNKHTVFQYKVCDIDNDGLNELALRSVLDDYVNGTNVIIDNVYSPNILYDLTPVSGAAWRGFVYDSVNDRLLYHSGKATIGQSYSIYSALENGKWITKSEYIREFSGDNTEPKVVSCYWENVNVTEDVFQANENELNSYDWIDSNDIFDIHINLPLEEVYNKLREYLSNHYTVNDIEKYISEDNTEMSIISVSNIFDIYVNNISYFNVDSGFITPVENMVRNFKDIGTTCFILNKTDNGTRIRFENCEGNINFKIEDNKLVAIKNDVPYLAVLSNENNDINNNILKLNTPQNGITQADIENLSNIQLSIYAKTRAHDGLVLREGPSTETKQIDLIPYGTQIKVTSLNDGYKNGVINDSMVKIEYNGKIGYVYSGYLLIDNTFDISSFTIEQKFAVGSLLYNQYNNLWFDFFHNGGIFDCTFTGEYSGSGGGYERLEPAGLTIDQLKKDYNLFFTKNIPLSYEGFDGTLYKEENGYLWRAIGFGADPSWYYNEVVEMTNNTSDEIQFKVVHHYDPQFYEYYGCEYIEEVFSIVFEDGRWKCDKLSPHI